MVLCNYLLIVLATVTGELPGHSDLTLISSSEPFPIRTPWGELTARDATPDELAAYLPLFHEEMALLPPELTAAVGLKRIVLCAELAFAGQRRVAVPLFGTGTYYLDVLLARSHPVYLRRCLHHDFYHIVDLRDDGVLDRDPGWAALNQPGFRYGPGGLNVYGKGNQNAPARWPGFVSTYATSAVEEDKAELFGYLMVQPRRVYAEAGGDLILAAKVRRLKAALQTFCPAADAAFWRRVEAARAESERRGRTIRWQGRRPRPRR